MLGRGRAVSTAYLQFQGIPVEAYSWPKPNGSIAQWSSREAAVRPATASRCPRICRVKAPVSLVWCQHLHGANGRLPRFMPDEGSIGTGDHGALRAVARGRGEYR